jgi:hypothetical protein
LTKKERWILSEWLVTRDRVTNHSESLYVHQHETPYAEIDLLFWPDKPGAPLTLIEVKAASRLVADNLWGTSIVARKQLARLEKARWYIEMKTKRCVRLIIAVVDPPRVTRMPQSRIRYFEAPFF